MANRPKEAHRPAPEVHSDILAVEAALEELRQQAIEEVLTASSTIRERVAPRHAALVADMAEHMLALHASFADYVAFTGELNGKGIAWAQLRAMHPAFCGEPSDPWSPVAMWLREAAQYGFIDREQIPEGLRHG